MSRTSFLWQYSYSMTLSTLPCLCAWWWSCFIGSHRGDETQQHSWTGHTLGLKIEFSASGVIAHADPRICSILLPNPLFISEEGFSTSPNRLQILRWEELKSMEFSSKTENGLDFWRSLPRLGPLRRLLQANPTGNHSDFVNKTLKLSGKVYLLRRQKQGS